MWRFRCCRSVSVSGNGGRVRGTCSSALAYPRAPIAPFSAYPAANNSAFAVARALINDPSLILADEPTSNIDAEVAHLIIELLADLRRRGRAILVASHDAVWQQQEEAEVYQVSEGKLNFLDRINRNDRNKIR